MWIVLQLLKEKELVAKLRELYFGTSGSLWLGHVTLVARVSVEPSKSDAVGFGLDFCYC